ncbi:MAG TPA: hypothetical protein DCL54_07750 [Alphaproteobacteria bacterium]|nr:hypothetical protein [Alphaproteobacteria bacterium]HAJ46457.1 hypothetical protein [Alphaproteobacteria bacterium]
MGAVIGNSTGRGSGNAKSGALLGAAIGGAACGVWLAFESEKDKRLLAESQMKALKAGKAHREEWLGVDGRRRSVLATPGAQGLTKVKVESGDPQEKLCRPVTVVASVEAQSETVEVLYCRTGEGDYLPATRAV